MNKKVNSFNFPILDRDYKNQLLEIGNTGISNRRYNPTIIQSSDSQILMLLRKSNRYFSKFIPFLGPIENIQVEESMSSLDCVYLDFNLNILEEKQISSLGLDPTIEDLRVNNIDGELYGLGAYLENDNGKQYARSALIDLGSFENPRLEIGARLLSAANQANKNFVWFQSKNEIITRVQPFQAGTEISVDTGYFIPDDYRAGSNFVRLDDNNWLGIVRKWSDLPALNQIYIHQFVTYNQSTEEIHFGKKFSLTQHGISICHGLLLTNTHLYLSWGFYDQKAYIAKWDRTLLDEFLEPNDEETSFLVSFLFRDMKSAILAYKSTKLNS